MILIGNSHCEYIHGDGGDDDGDNLEKSLGVKGLMLKVNRTGMLEKMVVMTVMNAVNDGKDDGDDEHRVGLLLENASP